MSEQLPIMKLKIVSDGKTIGTQIQVINESGEAVGELVCVRKLTWVCDINPDDPEDRGFTTATMTVPDVETDIAHDVILTPADDQGGESDGTGES